MTSEPVRIGEILPDVMTDIARRMELYRPEHKAGVLAAIKGYNEGRSRKQGYCRQARARKHNQGDTGRPMAYSGKLFGQQCNSASVASSQAPEAHSPLNEPLGTTPDIEFKNYIRDTKAEGKEFAGALLDAEARIGDLISEMSDYFAPR
jgi:hypothetical protein